MKNLLIATISILICAYGSSAQTDGKSKDSILQYGVSQMEKNLLFQKMTGKWEGICRTWFEPGKLADESKITGEIAGILDGRFLRHTYHGMIQGKPRNGEELISFNSITEMFQVSWVDDFHMNYAIMFSEGRGTRRGFSVRGDYDVGKNQPKWGWRSEFELLDDDHLTITSYNIQPGAVESKAVETIYSRAKQGDSINR